MIIISISWFLVLLYILLILRFYWSWTQLEIQEINTTKSHKISIVIAIRNEEKQLAELFKSIINLDYPKSHYEVILINDHSNDSSLFLMDQFKSSNTEIDIHISSLIKKESGKKAALKNAFSKAKYDIIQCTDGDCILPKYWLQHCAKAFENHKTKLISGGIKLTPDPSFFKSIQSLEILSLIASGAAAIGIEKPIMSNGANMAFRKEILEIKNEDVLKSHLASGDDVFLLQEVKKAFGSESISFIKNQNYWVETKAEPRISEWINQRLRWVSKSAGYKDHFLIFTSLLVFLANLALIILLLGSFFYLQLASTLLYLFILKGITDYIFLKQSASDSSQKYLLKWFIPLNFIYPFFITYTAIAGQFKGFTWKNRVYKK